MSAQIVCPDDLLARYKGIKSLRRTFGNAKIGQCLLYTYSVEKLHFLRRQEIYDRLSDLISIRYEGA